MTLPDVFLHWLAAHPFWADGLAWACLAGTIVAAWGADSGGWGGWRGRLVFFSAVMLTLVAFRWPAWFVPTDLNPDEAQTLAGAITLKSFPVYWKYVDGATHGPLCEFPLVVLGWLGAPMNYLTARIVAVLMQAGALLGVWGTVRCWSDERTARLAVLPPLAFWSMALAEDYVHYSSEFPAVTLLALAGWGLAVALTSAPDAKSRSWPAALAGMALGAVPFAKLQAVPEAALLAAIGFLTLWWRRREATANARHLTLCLVAGGVVVPLAIAVELTVFGLWAQFGWSYISANLAYPGEGVRLAEMPARFLAVATSGFAFAWFALGTLAFALFFQREARDGSPRVRLALTLAWLLAAVAFFCVIAPRRETPHYLHLLVVPIALIAGLTLAGPARNGRSFLRLAVWFGALAVAPQAWQWAINGKVHRDGFAEYRAAQSAAGRYLREHSTDDDLLTVWGWEPDLYVQSGLPQATREGNTTWEISSWPLQQFYLSRYLRDLARHEPTWFVDAVGPGSFIYTSRANYAHENFPSVQEFVAARYELVAEFGNKRIYRRKGSR